MVNGDFYQNANVRNAPVVSSASFVKTYVKDTTFEGEVVTGNDGREWVKMSKINGAAVSNLYVAAWVVNVRPMTETPPVPAETFPAFFWLEEPGGERRKYNLADG